MTERFARVPVPFIALLERGEISLTQLGLVTYLAGRAEFRSGQWTGELELLRTQSCYPHGPEQLRRDLHVLRDAGAIGFEVKKGQRRPWVIRLDKGFGVGLKRDLHLTSTSPTPSQVEVTSTGRDLHEGATALAEPDSSALPPPPDQAPTDPDNRQLQEHSLAPVAGATSRPREPPLNRETLRALHELVMDLEDADERTEVTFVRHFGHLAANCIQEAHREILSKSPENDAEYAYGLLANVANGQSWIVARDQIFHENEPTLEQALLDPELFRHHIAPYAQLVGDA